MIRTYRRAAEEKDFSATGRKAGSLGRNLLRVSLPLSVVAAGLVRLLSGSLIAALVVGVALFAASAWSNWSFFAELRRRRGAQANPDSIEVTEVDAARLLEIGHLGSHGPAWVFLTSEGHALLLVGQWLNEMMRLPTLSFRLHRWSDNGKPIRIETQGSRVIPESSPVELHARYRFKDIEVFDASAETLQADLDKAFAKAR